MVNEVTHKAEGRTLSIERSFDAPRELVFECWTDGDKLTKWWAPNNWTTPVSKMDMRPGGQWHYCMKGPDDGSEWANYEAWGLALIKEVDPPKKLVWEDAFSDETGEVNTEMPTSTITFEFFDEDGKTRVQATAVYATEADLQKVIEMQMIDGMTSAFVNLDNLLASLS